jgi:hypothetical protein
MDDTRYYKTLYGIETNDWSADFGSFSNHPKLLVEEYVSDAASTEDTSVATDGDVHDFLYNQHIKKRYFIEGVITGHITVASSLAEATVTSYRVTVCKVHEDTTETELFSTGWVTVNDTLEWDAVYDVGDEIVYPFWIDAWQYEALTDRERIFVRVEVDGDANTVLWHSNNTTYCDLMIEIPIRM